MNLLLANMNPLEHIASRELFRIGTTDFVFTNHMFMITLAAVLLVVVLPLAVGKKLIIRTGLGNVVEAVCVYIREEVARPFLKEQTDKYVPYLWTMFFFILTLNLLGLVPLESIIWLFTGKAQTHLGGAATANVYVTGALALLSFLLFNLAGVHENGLINYVKNFAPKVPIFILPFIFLIEVISSFIRVFSLAIRLFANMLAGHVLLATLLGFILMFKNFPVATASVIFTIMRAIWTARSRSSMRE